MEAFYDLAQTLVPSTYIRQGQAGIQSRWKLIRQLLAERNVPERGWDDPTIELFLHHLAQMDSNNFMTHVGVGEREARIASTLVYQRHYGFGHGMGRSGDIAAVQPKAAGSSLLVQLLNILVLKVLRVAGCLGMNAALVLPVATGMSLTLTLLTLMARQEQQREKTFDRPRYVIWSRIDQKSCLKSIFTAHLEPLIVEPVFCPSSPDDEWDQQLETDTGAIEALLAQHAEAGDVLGVLTTTSCFAPRARDDVVAVAKLCRQYRVFHVINNAYGVQSTACCHEISKALRSGEVSAVIQSTDKNFMVPVGGAIITSPHADLIQDIAQQYPGRGNSTPLLDLLITFLHWGKSGYRKMLHQRQESRAYLEERLIQVAHAHGERVLHTPSNDISFAISLGDRLHHSESQSETLEKQTKRMSFFGAMLFQRGVSGARVITPSLNPKIFSKEIQLTNFGSHSSTAFRDQCYFTVACAIGLTKDEIDVFISRLDSCWTAYEKKFSPRQLS